MKVIQTLKNQTKLHYILYIVAFLGLFLTFSSQAVFAENIDYSVTIKPSLRVTISPNPVVLNLNPASNPFNTINVNVSVGTNNPYGYKLYMNTDDDTTTGNSQTKLERDSSVDGVVADIPTLSNNSSTTPCTTSYTNTTFTTNSWGYRINNDVGGEANCIDTTSTNYYAYTPNTLISSTTTATNNNIANLTFASKIDYNKPAGEYDLTLKMKALPTVTTYYMQDIATDQTLASTVCTEEPTVVIDKRDEKAYTIRRINGTCWLVENLQFVGTELDSTTSNVAPEYTPQNPYRVNGGSGYYDSIADGGTDGNCNHSSGGFINSCIHKGDVTIQNTPIGSSASSITISTVWYNYPAASAGTMTKKNSTSPIMYDICPKGWKLPSGTDASSIGNTTGTYIAEFNPITGGSYYDGTIVGTSVGQGLWWTTSVKNNQERHFLTYNNTDPNNPYMNYGGWYKASNIYIRCVMKDFGINDLTYMQDFAKLNESGNVAKKQQVFNSMGEEESYQLKDIRESGVNSYYISKLKDGKVWMVQNLQLGKSLTATSGTLSLTPSDSNISSNWTLTNKVVSPGKMPYTTITNDPVVSGGKAYINDGNAYYCAPDSNDYYETCYYNWYTATAGTGTSSTAGGINTTYNICPKGWTLPTGGPNSDFQTLVSVYEKSTPAETASAMLVANPTTCTSSGASACGNANGVYMPGFSLIGRTLSTGTGSMNVRGDDWSRTSYSIGHVYTFVVSTAGANFQDHGDKYYGWGIRCLVYPN